MNRPQTTEHPALQFVWDQFNNRNAQNELRKMGPSGMDWVVRTKKTLETLLPMLPVLAQNLVREVPDALNAAILVRALLEKGEKILPLSGPNQKGLLAWYHELQEAADKAQATIGNLESQQISSAIQRYVISDRGLGALVARNGNSIYPDLILKDRSYSSLPRQSRKIPVDGPCLRGANPSNVPDGCEIKTNQGIRVKVDAHGAHPGLHVGVTWDFDDGAVRITGVWVAYICISDHRESGRNVKVTTVKYSFGHDLFKSLL